MIKKIISVAVLGLSVFTLASCKKSSQQEKSYQTNSAGSPIKNDRLVLWLEANPEILNPIIASDAYAREVTDNVFDTLVSYNVKTGDPEGRLAESWNVSKDGLIYNFKIRKNATWHDGKPLTA